MSEFVDVAREDQRLLILQKLQGEADYSAHEHLLRQGLASYGYHISADAMRGHLAWLDEQGLIVLATGEIAVATLTMRGEDAATGAARVHGVARPRPTWGR
jgi:repressor of nif and glnA expression